MTHSSPDSSKYRALQFPICIALFSLSILFVNPDASAQQGVKFQWHIKRDSTPQPLTPEQLEEIERLESQGYSGGETAQATSMITRYDEQLCYNGLNLYLSAYAPAANLIDMSGKVLHRWTYDKAVQGALLANASDDQKWHMAHVYPNGDIIVLQHLQGLLKLDKDSNVIWARTPGWVHHDMDVREDGSIYVLTRNATVRLSMSENYPILDDTITQLDADGEIVRVVSILDCMENAGEYGLLAEARGNLKRDRGDILHTNTIEVLDGSIGARVPEFQKGRILISCRSIDTILVLDLDQEKVVWWRKGPWQYQHDPGVLENGNLLIFDNNWRDKRSAIREFDPTNGKESWVYKGTEEDPFFSFQNGRCDRLPNGNTLIVESIFGRVFEVTPDKEIVWEFWNPERSGEDGEYIARVYECLRLPPDYFGSWLDPGPSKN